MEIVKAAAGTAAAVAAAAEGLKIGRTGRHHSAIEYRNLLPSPS
jgi:hypothetical protein